MGPGLLVAAAFIGPGTIVTASRAGAHYGTALLWAVVFSAAATAVLQEMAARVGLVTGRGLSEAMRASFRKPLLRWLALALVTVAIAFGNAAYETGNLLGASLGLEILTGISPRVWTVVLAVAAAALLYSGAYRVIQRALIALVIVMSGVFFATALMVQPSLASLAAGLVPQAPTGSLLTVIALIGTTVVPYNLFLHASAVQEKWSDMPTTQALTESRWDTSLSVLLGGLVTVAIVVAATPLSDAESLGAVADQLEPVLGRGARTFFGLGLFAAGLTSTITAPLAAAYAVSGALGFAPELGSSRFRIVWGVVLLSGLVLALSGGSPTEAILVAQAANGLLLPVIAVFLLSVVNDRESMGERANGPVSNALGVLVVLVVAGLGGYQLLRVLSAV